MAQERPLGPIFEDPDEHRSDQTKSKKSRSRDNSFSEDDDSIGLPAFQSAKPNKITFPKSSFNNFIHYTNKPNENADADTNPAERDAPSMTFSQKNTVSIPTADLLGDLDNTPNPFSTKPNPALNFPLKPSNFGVPKRMTRIVDFPAHDQESDPDSIAEVGGLDSDSAEELPPDSLSPRRSPLRENAETEGVNETPDKISVNVALGPDDRANIRPPAERPDMPFSIESWQERRFSSTITKSQVEQSPSAAVNHTGQPLSQYETSQLEVEIVHLQTALAAANAEIEDLVKAVHHKDQNVIEAQETIKRLAGGVDRRESFERGQRVERTMGRLKELEDENEQLKTDKQKHQQENAAFREILHDIEKILGMDTVPADDQELLIHMKARINNLVETERKTSAKQLNKADNMEDWDIFQHEASSLRRALSIKDEQSAQNEKRRIQLEEQRKKMESELVDLQTKTKQQEELNHLVAAEARTLSDELKHAHAVIERKDAVIMEMGHHNYENLNGNELHHNSFDSVLEQNANYTALLIENTDLKAKLTAVSQQLKDSGRTDADFPYEPSTSVQPASGRLHSHRPDLVSDKQQLEHRNGTRSARRELRIVNAALAQVVSSANTAINHLKAENSSLFARIGELERTDSQHRQEISDKKQHIDQLLVELSTARAALQSSNQMHIRQDLARQRSSIEQEWSGLPLKDSIFGEFSAIIKEISAERLQLLQSVLSQQRSTDNLAEVQHDVRHLQNKFDSNVNQIQSGQDKLLTLLQQYIVKSKSDDARIISDYHDHIISLQKIVTEKDMEIQNMNDSLMQYKQNSEASCETGKRPEIGDPVTTRPKGHDFQSTKKSTTARYHSYNDWETDLPEGHAVLMQAADLSGSAVTKENNKTSSDRHIHMQQNNVSGTLLSAFSETLERPFFPHGSPELDVSYIHYSKKNLNTRTTNQPDANQVELYKRNFMSKFENIEPEKKFEPSDSKEQNMDKWMPKIPLHYIKLELPRVDYASIRQRSVMQLEQLKHLSDRIEKANSRYASYLPKKAQTML
ncbi:kinesin-like protein KIF16B isoform X2 [Paramacrobiotus metropolitanus]|uniref:kinesin-like protein KIF16B isoform X2 n=1 Tax=Paramacrobiotus metropolitanus TaxID=2943436 RepID=UPI00244652DD|nr:kinesin-like protein KIF16B isoform X2 [Paramacrobiotus metropolitanus]